MVVYNSVLYLVKDYSRKKRMMMAELPGYDYWICSSTLTGLSNIWMILLVISQILIIFEGRKKIVGPVLGPLYL